MRSPRGRDDVGDSRSLNRGGGENKGNSVVVVSRRATDPIPVNEKKKITPKRGLRIGKKILVYLCTKRGNKNVY